ncbi:MAG: caspase family protein [Paracoccaceae bacterium]
MFRLLILAVCLFHAAFVAAQEQRVALLYGNSDYQHVGPLDNPINDASDVAIALKGLGFKVFLRTDGTKEEMLAVADEFAAAAETADVAMFFFAGHGFQVNGRNYLVPVDAKIQQSSDIAAQTIAMDEILERLERSKGLKLVFLDACRDNPFEGTDTGGEAGLARVGSAADYLIAYSTQPDNVAYDGSGRNSFFTEALLNHIYTPGQDIADLMINVRKDVLATTGGLQVPWENSSLTRQFRFDNSPVTASEETMLWQVAADTGDPRLMQLYMDAYPQGAHVEDVVAFLDNGDTQTRTLQGDDAASEDRLWKLAQRSRSRPLLEFYVQQHPEGAHVDQAQRLLASIPRPEDATPGTMCERLATHPRDKTAKAPGVSFSLLQQNSLVAVQACSAAMVQSPDLPHYIALLARSMAAAGDLDRAVGLYQRASERGDLRAMVSLAFLYETGTGVAQDNARALQLYEEAVAGGSPDAMINLAVTLFEGASVPRDEARAIDLLRRAADIGSPKAIYNLGVLAQDGVTGSPEEALDLFGRAAQLGEIPGYRAAAVLLDEGRGVDRDPEQAANMLLRGLASDRGQVLKELTEQTGNWSRDTISAIQVRLAAAGFYEATIDGLPGPSFTEAAQRWRNGGFDPNLLTN